MKRLVLLGGGHAHVEVLRDLAEKPDERFSITLISPFPRLAYTGMLPGVVAGHYRLEQTAIDLVRLAQRARATIFQTSAALVNPVAREVMCSDGTVVAYDALSINVGSEPLVAGATGVDKHAVTIRPLDRFLKGWGEVLIRAREGRIKSVTMVGGGAGGVELALAMEYRFRRDQASPLPHVRVITNTADIVPEFPEGARRRLRRQMARRNIGVHPSSTVVEVGSGHVRLNTGLEFVSDATFWAAGAAAPEWLKLSGFATDDKGFILTNDALQSVTFREVFAAGDCATQEGRPHARAGVFAVRAAPVLAANLRAALLDEPLARFTTPPKYLALVSTGRKSAVGVWGDLAWQGMWLWYVKDRIDRKWVEKYR